MDITLEPGKYVVAVSGGLDSVALLHKLFQKYGSPEKAGDQRLETRDRVQLIVAHFNHGIRPESALDAKFVEELATKYGLAYLSKREELGTNASEQLARERRYKFLTSVMKGQEAKAIITAHHKDDVVETAYLNTARGTGRRGLTSLNSSERIIRPLLHISKRTIKDYAKSKGLKWREDSSNSDQRYLRNKIRLLLSNAGLEKTDQMYGIIQNMRLINEEIDNIIEELWGKALLNDSLQRSLFINVPYGVACELMASWLRKHDLTFDKRLIHRLVIASRTARPGTQYDIDKNYYMKLELKQIRMQPRSSV